MSDYYSDFDIFIITAIIIGAITLPIWGPPYFVYWLVKGRKEDQKNEIERLRRQVELEEYAKSHPPRIKQPRVWRSRAEQEEWDKVMKAYRSKAEQEELDEIMKYVKEPNEKE
jgi:hypothetical protein